MIHERVDLKVLWEAVIEVETGGVDLRNEAIGDGGRSVGIAQMGKAVIKDVNLHYKTDYKWHDDPLTRTVKNDSRLDPDVSYEIFCKYLQYWAKSFTKKNVPKKATYDVLARIWNGGPTGYKKTATIPYWHRVLAILMTTVEY